MATATHFPISVSEYLYTSFQPDCDYVDGVIEERDLGELEHAEVQRAFILWLSQQEREWGIRTLPKSAFRRLRPVSALLTLPLLRSLRPASRSFRHRPSRLLRFFRPKIEFRATPSTSTTTARCASEISGSSIPTRKGFDCPTGNWIETAQFAGAGSGIHIDLTAIFAYIDEDRSR
jgi:hypothetical protein